MNDVAVLTRTGIPLMPTSRYRARRLIAAGKAVICKHRPVFTIMLMERETGVVQPMELKMDTGYEKIGVSVCSEKHEYLHREYTLLTDETERHDTQRKLRRSRRNRKRYRKPRFDNRKGLIAKDGFAPSIRNKRDRHVDIFRGLCGVFPITRAEIETGSFDTQVLKAVEEGKPLPEGTDYQHGEQYGFATLRNAVFARDGYTCQCCGKSPFSKVPGRMAGFLSVHHIGFWKADRTNRMANLLTVCDKCHTAREHKPGGKLYSLEPKLRTFKGASFMTGVRHDMVRRMREARPDVELHVTYGAMTKLKRQELGLPKTHANDAFSMGTFHPEHRAHLQAFRKRRRNSRVLEKFYDAVYMDVRDGKKKKGSELSCGRTKRSIPRDNPGNERIFRGHKVSAGRRAVRRQRHPVQPGALLAIPGGTARAKGTHCGGTRVMLDNGRSVLIRKITILRFPHTWERTV